jgi:hypothetical protein
MKIVAATKRAARAVPAGEEATVSLHLCHATATYRESTTWYEME